MRGARDAYSQKRVEIGRELRAVQELARLHEVRLSHTVTILSAVEDLLGEVRARFRAKGIPIVDPRHLPPYRMPQSLATVTGPVVECVEPHPIGVGNEVSPLSVLGSGDPETSQTQHVE